MSPGTIFLGRLIGLFFIILSVSMIAHKRATIELMIALVQNSPVLFVFSVVGVVAGLATVLGHNIWRGGALPIIVTLIGWWTLIKSALVLFLWPEPGFRSFLGAVNYAQGFYLYAAILLLAGVYLVFASRRPAT